MVLSSSKIYFLAFRILHKDLKSSFVTQSLSAHLSKTTQQQKMTQNCYHRSKPANQKKVIATCLLQNYINLLWLSSWSTDATRGHREYVFSRFSTATYSPWDSLNMFFFLSIIFIAPFGCNSPISPAIFSELCQESYFFSLVTP